MAIHVKENNKAIGPDTPTSMHAAPADRPKFEMDENGKPIFPPEFLEKMAERDKLNCPTGQGIVDWKAVKAAADAQWDGEVHYIVEREASYDGKDRLDCLAEDAAWLLKNL